MSEKLGAKMIEEDAVDMDLPLESRKMDEKKVSNDCSTRTSSITIGREIFEHVTICKV